MIFNPGVQIDVYQVKSLSKRIILFIYDVVFVPRGTKPEVANLRSR